MDKYCMCEEIGAVARDGKSTCLNCGGRDAYGARARIIMKEVMEGKKMNEKGLNSHDEILFLRDLNHFMTDVNDSSDLIDFKKELRRKLNIHITELIIDYGEPVRIINKSGTKIK